jgi:AraC-like DNA-binding protein
LKIKENIFNLKNGKYENWLFAQMLILVTVPLVIMGLIAYVIYYKGEIRQKRQQLDSYCESMCMEYDNILSTIREYYMDASMNDSFRWLIHQTEPPYSQQSQVAYAQGFLRGNYFMMGYIKGYNFINVQEGWVLNNYGMFSYEDLRNREEVDQFIREQEENPLNVYWLNRSDIQSPYLSSVKESRLVDTSKEQFVLKETTESGSVTYILLVQLDTEPLRQIMERERARGFEFLLVSDGKILIESSQDFGESREKAGETGEYPGYEVSIHNSDVNRLVCVAGYDRGRASQEGAVFVWASLLFAAAMCMVIIIIRYCSIVFSKPVFNLQRLVDSQSLQMKEMFLSNIIKGERSGGSEAEISRMLQNLELEPCPVYRLVTVALKSKKQDSGGEGEQRILDSLPETVTELLFSVPIRRETYLIFLVGGGEEMELDNRTALLYKRLKDHVWEEFETFIALGISCPFTRLSQGKRAYEECREALHNRLNQSQDHTSLVLYDDYSLKSHSTNVYDIVVVDELVNAVASGNEEEAGRLLDLILERMERREVTGIDRNFYVTRLNTAMIEALLKQDLSLGDIFDQGQYGDVSQASQIYDREQLSAYMKEKIIGPLTRAAKGRGDRQETWVTSEALRMIKESKGTISLAECAQALNYHPNHIGKLLKRDTGKTFLELANEEKMELARYMLLTTDYSVAEISQKLQYNNVQNFIRFFKSNAQITPAAFRKAHK